MAPDLDRPEPSGAAAVTWAERAAGRLAAALAAAVAARGRASIALAGGKTPAEAYARLSTLDLPWERIDVFFSDERAVPPDDPASNYRMAVESLLDPAGVPSARRHRMPGERPDLDAAAREYAAAMPDRLDVLVLGVGDDGHTASLFPGSPALSERTRRVVPADSPFPPPRRLTVTPPVLEAAREIVVLVRGAAKAPAVARALEGPADPAACPASLARRGTWITDEAAAAGLRKPK